MPSRLASNRCNLPSGSPVFRQLNKLFFSLSITAFYIAISGCSFEKKSQPKQRSLRIATTTSTRDSGLTDVLIPVFENEHNVKVKLIAVGTGKALKLGRMGEADVVFVHAKEAELEFMKNGHATRREQVMFNYFVILGPSSDPAGINKQLPAKALQQICDSNAVFVSRGDDSGTHKKEKNLWGLADRNPDFKNYVETGQGMGATLMIADQKQGYTLCDQGTYLAMRKKISLVPLVQKSETMKNTYGVLCIDSSNHPAVKEDLANLFADFMISAKTQKTIRDFTIDGEPLFYPITTDN